MSDTQALIQRLQAQHHRLANDEADLIQEAADALESQAKQIEELQSQIRLVQSAAKAVVASKDAQHVLIARERGAMMSAAADVSGERAANSILTEENERLRGQIEELTKALRAISQIEDQMVGPDWEEINLARDIANAALQAEEGKT